MLEMVVTFFTAASVGELLLIFVSKVIEVTMGTLRGILINKGYRRQGSILAFFEIILWVFVASRVINGIADAPIKGIVYSIGFALGVNLGSRIENYIALGNVLIQTIVSKENSGIMASELRAKGYAVTTVEAKGRDSDKTVLMIFAKRKGKEDIIKEIHRTDGTAMIITNDVSTLHGGYISPATKSPAK
ncbi:DUF2179 domain-containing protein [Breznakiella homolactica]|uniref:DUF2179 domain-containing protein n=1 Tax=Breznakiella homolactica TaxID=2798577 RepID=A0A7T7XQC0_9SPIR|nr:DUF5698 domain-containing protein [Breznakiella homolactica]QQO10545.1 DUF5698 domain-containing protein [Breznakiella homolactica]